MATYLRHRRCISARNASLRCGSARPVPCALEKKFNKRVAVLVAAGHTQPEAENLANEDVSLDRFVALAPLCMYGELAPERHLGVQTERVSAANVSLIDIEPVRLVSLSSLAQAHLKATLAKDWAYHDLSRYDELPKRCASA